MNRVANRRQWRLRLRAHGYWPQARGTLPVPPLKIYPAHQTATTRANPPGAACEGQREERAGAVDMTSDLID